MASENLRVVRQAFFEKAQHGPSYGRRIASAAAVAAGPAASSVSSSCLPSSSGSGSSIGYSPSKQARHRFGLAIVVASIMPSMEMYASESAPSDLPISSTDRPLAISSARVAKSMPKKQGHFTGGEEIRMW